MPGGDRTGPAGFGPVTGRGAGFCAGYSMPGYASPVSGRGMGMGRGRGFRGGGRGRRNWFYATGAPGWSRAAQGMPAWGGYGGSAGGYPYSSGAGAEQEQEALKQQADYLQQSLNDVNQRIQKLEKKT